MNWKDKVKVNEVPIPVFSEPKPTATELREAAQRYADRTDGFATGKAAICLDLARRLEKFGSYASDKQRDFAAKLVEWSLPRERPAKEWTDPAPGRLSIEKDPSYYRPQNTVQVPDLFAVMQKHSTFYVNSFRIHRKNQDTLCWILHDDMVVGKIENGTATVWPNKCVNSGVLTQTVIDLLNEFEKDPLGAAMKWGKLAGRCCSCGRDLTDPESIANGIGPVCATKFA